MLSTASHRISGWDIASHVSTPTVLLSEGAVLSHNDNPELEWVFIGIARRHDDHDEVAMLWYVLTRRLSCISVSYHIPFFAQLRASGLVYPTTSSSVSARFPQLHAAMHSSRPQIQSLRGVSLVASRRTRCASVHRISQRRVSSCSSARACGHHDRLAIDTGGTDRHAASPRSVGIGVVACCASRREQ